MRTFDFFLSAWHFCVMYNLPMSAIKRHDWKTWVVEYDGEIENEEESQE